MKYGLHLPNFGPFGDPQTLVNLARDAEQAGWDELWKPWDVEPLRARILAGPPR